MPSDLPTSIVSRNASRTGCGTLATRLVEEMVQRWDAGERPDAADYLELFSIAVVAGLICLPERPGLGIELNRDALRKYRVDGRG